MTAKQLAARIMGTPDLTEAERSLLRTMQPGLPLLCFGEREIEIGKHIQKKLPEIKLTELHEWDRHL